MTARCHYRVRKIRLEDEGKETGVEDMTPSQRVEMVWQLTLQAWYFKEGLTDEPQLRRDVVRTIRSSLSASESKNRLEMEE